MTSLEHDGAASLRVEWMDSSNGRIGGAYGRATIVAGWYVVRTCPCHNGQPITRPFGSREDAVVAIAMLDEDATRYQ